MCKTQFDIVLRQAKIYEGKPIKWLIMQRKMHSR